MLVWEPSREVFLCMLSHFNSTISNKDYIEWELSRGLCKCRACWVSTRTSLQSQNVYKAQCMWQPVCHSSTESGDRGSFSQSKLAEELRETPLPWLKWREAEDDSQDQTGASTHNVPKHSHTCAPILHICTHITHMQK